LYIIGFPHIDRDPAELERLAEELTIASWKSKQAHQLVVAHHPTRATPLTRFSALESRQQRKLRHCTISLSRRHRSMAHKPSKHPSRVNRARTAQDFPAYIFDSLFP
jgi:hypothetical protein